MCLSRLESKNNLCGAWLSLSMVKLDIWGTSAARNSHQKHSWFMLCQTGFLKAQANIRYVRNPYQIPSLSSFLSSETMPKHPQILQAQFGSYQKSPSATAVCQFPTSHLRLVSLDSTILARKKWNFEPSNHGWLCLWVFGFKIVILGSYLLISPTLRKKEWLRILSKNKNEPSSMGIFPYIRQWMLLKM